ncbi:PD-(D/E)XK nuclease family protein [Haloprofundus halobius]|uniref:PD-(D/E)XK nuclease family protein n=1 Tax=Haloprofundus halobius TaxID=2876194 RepID=UPI001CCAB8D7|nr:PD-(D/E)XK nuclease family protein [Haloprofundus halobius]
MFHRLLITGSDFSTLESEAFEELSTDVGTHPESLLYLTPRDHPKETVKDRWRDFGPSAAIRVDTLDGMVSEWYEQERYKGPVTHIDQPLLSRLAELGVEGIDSSANPLFTNDRFPSSGLVQEAKALFTELEFAGLLSADEMRSRLTDEGLSSHASHVEELADEIEAARAEILAETVQETYRSERMHQVVSGPSTPDEVFPAVDAVVLSGFTQFTALEAELIRSVAECWPVIALLPMQVDSDSPTGIDRGVERVAKRYYELGFSRRYLSETDSHSIDARRQIVRSLYRHPSQSPATGDIEATALDLTIIRPETVPEETRVVARSIRTQLASGIQPENIGVVLPSPVQYARRVCEVFDSYDLPMSRQTDVPLTETATGDLVQTVCQLAHEPRTLDSVLNLLTNPLVDCTRFSDELDYQHLSRVAARVETARLDSTLEHADDDIAEAVNLLVSNIEALADESLETLPETLNALFEQLGVTESLSEDHSQRLRLLEKSAQDRLNRVLETLKLTAKRADLTLGNSLDRLERVLYDISIPATGRPSDQSIVVCGLAEAVARDFDQLYILGVTAAHFPSNADRMAFTQPIYDAHPDFEQLDVTAEARYHFGALLGSEASIQLSVPQRSMSGEPYVEADVLTELRRVVNLPEITVETVDSQPGCQEDVQRSIGGTSETRTDELVMQAVDAGTFDSDQQSRIRAGVECAAARASPDLTPYDGQLTTETVANVHEVAAREPYSPSRLETYAACGFNYYMQRVLGIKAPDPITREPDAGLRGSYIHDVLEHYYRSLQSSLGDPVDPGGEFDDRQERLLEVALDRLTETFDGYSKTAFHQQWLRTVLAGLGSPETNPYYHSTEAQNDAQHARGLFYRFLEHEFDEPAKTTARPAWFEGRIGNPYDAGTPISENSTNVETPQGSIPIHGLIDRVETVPGTDPTQVVVRDYKTGNSIPSESDALSGLKFQLQLYALMAEDALDDVEVVGGAYYQVSPPSSVNSRRSLLTSQEMAEYYGSDDVESPLLRYSYPHFETHEAFRRFIEETTPQRLGDLATGITDGQYHPTVLDPADAGCRYCDYAQVCDVRSHQRRDTIEAIDDTGNSAYIPLKARNIDLEEAVEVE